MPKICLLILDGFGIGNGDPLTDAIAAARMPFLHGLFSKYPWTKLSASGAGVGLMDGQFGNSEIGHMTIGAGRILPNLDEVITQELDHFQAPFRIGETVHIIGIYSDGLIHGDKRHIDRLIQILTKNKNHVVLHLISDGRDTKKYAFLGDLRALLDRIDPQFVSIGSISGRFYAMDRDQNWERVEQTYAAISGRHLTSLDPLAYVQSQYDHGIDDEMLVPVSFETTDLNDGTSIFTNYRPDRLIELLKIFQDNHLNFFTTVKIPHFPGENYLFDVDRKVDQTIDSVLARHHVSQLRVAETEKYAHVTYFFDGGQDAPNKDKRCILIPSNKIANHAQHPEMKAVEITDAVLENAKNFDFIVVNYANPDMLGHTGDFSAVVAGLEVIDRQIERIYNKIVKRFHGLLMVTADHGNADKMLLPDGEPLKTHTTALVPFLITDDHVALQTQTGTLAQIAPTILECFGISQPAEMTAISLLVGDSRAKN